ncbi:MAG: SGNH/GDSL hydrolase family protein [Candidatus Acidiferrales bacterium]|jgi:lysophospholipase L1-like esterase
MDQPPPLISKISFSIAFTVVLLVLIEVISAISFKITEVRQGGLENAQASAALSVYKSQPWAATYWREEVAAFNVLYEPYVIWRRAPFKGETIVIEDDGLRRTAHSDCSGQNYTIWIFGGSTMWGAGSPDWLTIPSLLAERYEKSGMPVCVRNYGTSAWVNTQETIEFMQELKRAPRKPDLVIFYDGVNDAFTLYQSGMIDVPQNNDRIKSKLQSGDPMQTGWNRPRSNSMVQTLLESKTFQSITRIGANLRRMRNPSQPEFSRQVSNDRIQTQMEVAYLKNLDLVSELGREYGFKYAFFWQPVMLAGNKRLSDEEKTILHKTLATNDGMQETFERMYNLAKSQKRQDFFDIADALDNREDTIYIDFAHLSPEGNRLVAERVYVILHQNGM